jgi:hypothetical protein
MIPEFNYDTSHIEWTHLEGGPEVDYRIDYDVAVLGSQPELGRLDLLVKFAPNSYCHFHRHVAATTTLVLEGEQHIYETDAGGKTVHKVRKAGAYAQSAGGDVHRECGGPEGAVVFFAMHSPNGRVFDLLDEEGHTLVSTTIEEMSDGVISV